MKTAHLRLLSLLLPMLLAACSGEPAPKEAPRRVAMHEVQIGNAEEIANYSGEVRPRIETAMSFRVAGKIAARLVQVGDTVKAGQVLARLDPADVELGAASARAQLAAAESERGLAKAEVERYRELRSKNFISQSALDAKEAAFKSAQGRWESASAQSSLARNQSSYAALTADAAGVVSAVQAEVGQVVAAGQAVLSVARPGEKEVAISVPENRVAELRQAGKIDISLWADAARSYSGRIREVAPAADAVTRTYAARVTIVDADANVRLGMTANVLLRRPGGAASTLLPSAAIFQSSGQPAVWLIKADNTVELRPVEVLAFREDGALVGKGLANGDKVVAAGVHKLIAGEAVRPVAAALLRSGL